MILFDIETNGLLDPVKNPDGSTAPPLDKVHCLVVLDTDTGESTRFRGGDIPAHGLPLLSGARAIGGHNIIKFDIPALSRVYGWTYGGEVYDTLVMSRLGFADIKPGDLKLYKNGGLPGKLIGSHSLKAWGYRLNVHKGTYAEETEDCWSEWSREMEDYCERDVAVTHALYRKLDGLGLSPESTDLEHRFCAVIGRQERRGVAFDRRAAEALLVDLLDKREKAGEKLKEVFGGWWYAKDRTFTPKRDNRRLGYMAGCALTKLKKVEFKPVPGYGHFIMLEAPEIVCELIDNFLESCE